MTHFFRPQAGLSLWLTLCSAAIPVAGEVPPKVRLGTQIVDSQPFLDSHPVSLVECVFNFLPYDLVIRTMPWRRAQQDVGREALDGFFMAIPDAEVEQYAQLSAPLVLENWYWISLSHTSHDSLLENRRTGVILGSHQERWLWDKGLSPTLVAHDLPQLVKLLFSDRIDGVIADLETFERVATTMGVSRDRYRAEFISYMPLSVYMSRYFLQIYPEFLEQFNQHIPQCVQAPFLLNPREQEKVRQTLRLLGDWLNDETVFTAVTAFNRRHQSFSEEAITAVDNRWKTAMDQRDTGVLNAMVDAELSRKLRHWRDEYNFVTEIIITDAYGLNVATSPWSTDYWQGDEDKFLAAIGADYGQWYIGPVTYDESTRQFQVQVSVPLYLPGDILAGGVITVGVDVQMLLSGYGSD